MGARPSNRLLMAVEVSPMVAGMTFKLGIRSHFRLRHIQSIVPSFHVPGTMLAFVPEWLSLMEVRKESPRLVVANPNISNR